MVSQLLASLLCADNAVLRCIYLIRGFPTFEAMELALPGEVNRLRVLWLQASSAVFIRATKRLQERNRYEYLPMGLPYKQN